MRASSADFMARLEGVRPRHVTNLLSIVHQSEHRETAFIAARYRESSTNFEETVKFLEELGWLQVRNGRLEPAGTAGDELLKLDAATQQASLAEAVLAKGSPFERVFAQYLCQFKPSDGVLTHRPDIASRLREAGVRDFLMDVEAVSHRPDGDYFVLDGAFAHWVIWARNLTGPSVRQLAQHIEDRLELGLSAERAVMEWERERVGPEFSHCVRHISQDNPTACIDIQSVTVFDKQSRPRFIEVKAVGQQSFEFRWSRAEIEAAEILGSQYFLYLVPVPARGVFDLGNIQILQDAYHTVYKNSTNWLTTVADTICRRREESFAS